MTEEAATLTAKDEERNDGMKDEEMTEEPTFKLAFGDVEMGEEPTPQFTSDVEMADSVENDTAAPFEEDFKSETEATLISELVESSETQMTFKSEKSETDNNETTFKPEVATSFESEVAASDLNEILSTDFVLSEPTEISQDIATDFSENLEEKPAGDSDSIEAETEMTVLQKQTDTEDITPSVNIDIKDEKTRLNALPDKPMEILDDLLELPDSLPVENKPSLNVEEASAVDTSIVSNSIDGNLELSVKTTRTAAPSGVKIKINLFKKGPAAVTSNVSGCDTSAKSQVNTAQSVSVGSPLSQFLDESSLIDKPRLIGRKLTVLPPINKGVETSGLCCIM